MKDIKVNFTGASGAGLVLDAQVEDKDCCVQECLINLATEQGSDGLFEDRGTTLMYQALTGQIVGINEAAHAGNFAALDSARFIINNFPSMELADGTIKQSILQDIDVTEVTIENSELAYAVQIAFTDGTSTDTIDIALDVTQ